MKAETVTQAAGKLSAELKTELKKLIRELLNSSEAERAGMILEILQLAKKHCLPSKNDPMFVEITGQIIEELLGYLLSIRSTYESDYDNFLALLNQMPISQQSPFYQMLLTSLKDELDNDPAMIEMLDQLQIMHVMTEIGDMKTAGQMVTELGQKLDKSKLKLWTIYQVCRLPVLDMLHDQEELLGSQLDFITDTYLRNGHDSALTFVIRWIKKNSWGKRQSRKKELLMMLYNVLEEQRTLNSALVLYELFCMEDRLVPYEEKLVYQKKLIKLPASILNIKQLQHLYFFAGNYNCGMQSKFKESIRNYQYSNYFLHKRWEQLLNMSRFLREHLQQELYFQALPHLEQSIHELSNQVSLQNNAYVESLQAGYDKIEELYDRVGELSLTDSLTGLRNRRYLDNNLPQLLAFAARHDVPVSIAMIDIDFFKRINDTFGHQAGDSILRSLGRIITSQFRQSDIIIRYGGEEFLIVLFGLEVDKCLAMMEELRLLIQSHSFIYRKTVIPITVSIGIASDDLTQNKQPDLVRSIANSDKAMYQAKNSGRNKVVLYKPRKRACDAKIPQNHP